MFFRLEETLQLSFKSLILTSFSATSSLLADVDLTLTNVFATPLVPGPASDFSAIYTSLKRAHGVVT